MNGKMRILKNAIYIVVIVIINILFYGIWGVNHVPAAWISYLFIHIAAALVIVAPYLAERGREVALYTVVLDMVSIVYFIAELVVGFIFIIIQPIHFRPALFSQLIMFGVALIIMLANMIANAHTAESLDKREHELVYVKESASILKSLMSRITDDGASKKVEYVYDLINSSPIKSSPAVQELERQAMSEIDRLCSVVNNGGEDMNAEIIASTDKIKDLAEERNRRLKL
ncbi:MAG: hypothetical protein LUI02_00015 [Clostridiales bacterium]|nr:hypothetical protein [Clostridiales bacterium]